MNLRNIPLILSLLFVNAGAFNKESLEEELEALEGEVLTLLSEDNRRPKPPTDNVCKLDPDIGPCRAGHQRWYYDTSEKQCKEFNYGGCEGNGNNFGTKADCQKECREPKPLDNERPVAEPPTDKKCKLDRDSGPCWTAGDQRWYYDTSEKQCKEFIYGGCGGNENNFETKADCQKECRESKPLDGGGFDVRRGYDGGRGGGYDDRRGVGECPSSPPFDSPSCFVDTPIHCEYHPYQCIGEDEVNYNTWCNCEDGKFQCYVAKPYCENGFLTDPPTMEPKETKPPAEECPSEPPYVDVSCSVDTPTPCKYNPYKCVGDDIDSYSTWCYCRNGKFQCDESKPICTTCIECSNISSNAMKKKGKTCDGMTKLDRHCRRKRWKNKNRCQRSCYEAGLPYNGETCC